MSRLSWSNGIDQRGTSKCWGGRAERWAKTTTERQLQCLQRAADTSSIGCSSVSHAPRSAYLPLLMDVAEHRPCVVTVGFTTSLSLALAHPAISTTEDARFGVGRGLSYRVLSHERRKMPPPPPKIDPPALAFLFCPLTREGAHLRFYQTCCTYCLLVPCVAWGFLEFPRESSAALRRCPRRGGRRRARRARGLAARAIGEQSTVQGSLLPQRLTGEHLVAFFSSLFALSRLCLEGWCFFEH